MYQDILDFWFAPENVKKWYIKDDQFDDEIRHYFYDDYKEACGGKLNSWKDESLSALALIIVWDQFSRNLFRHDPRAFDQDFKAFELARSLVHQGQDQKLSVQQRKFVYMPFMHRENLKDQIFCVQLFQTIAERDPGYEWAIQHMQVIEKYGRFPHRNAVLGRKNTPAEEEYLHQNPQGF